MGVLKLISDGTIYEDNLDTATYIDVDGSAGIYPAYENALRDAYSFVNTASQDLSNGKFVINVPTGQTRSTFDIDSTILVEDGSYTIYFNASNISRINAQLTVSPYTVPFNITSGDEEQEITLDITYTGNTRFSFYPEVYDTDIEIEYTIVPKGYPKLQEWAGSQLTASLDSGVQSISFQLSDILGGGSQFNGIIKDNEEATILRMATGSSDDAFQMWIYGGSTSPSIITSENLIETDIFTLVFTDTTTSWYLNEVLQDSQSVARTTTLDSLEFFTTSSSFNISQLVTSTEESTGYPAGSTIQVSPTCKLGLLGSEIDLPEESRTLSSHNRIVKELESESANATLHTQFIATKEAMTINYDVITEANTTIIRGIEALQWDNNSRLNYITNEESGKLTSTTVKATVTTGGNRIMKGDYYNSGLTIELKEA